MLKPLFLFIVGLWLLGEIATPLPYQHSNVGLGGGGSEETWCLKEYNIGI